MSNDKMSNNIFLNARKVTLVGLRRVLNLCERVRVNLASKVTILQYSSW